MNRNLQKFGALPGKSGLLKKLLSKLAGRSHHVFPVPGLATLMANGFDPGQHGISIAPSPRHADILLIAAPLTPPLCRHAAVVYAQMPRPRMLVFVDIEKADPLPGPDLILSSADLPRFSSHIKDVNLWSMDALPYEPEHIRQILEKMGKGGDGGHHHEHNHGHNAANAEESDHHHEQAGQGQNHHQQNQGEGHQEKSGEQQHEHHGEEKKKQDGHGKKGGKHEDYGHGEGGGPQVHKNHSEGGDQREHENHGGRDHREHENHGEGGDHNSHSHHEDGGHEGHGGMGFMSMVEMTKNMPRSLDGLPMEMNETRFGPFFPGLPDGMRLKVMLDGDTVMKAEYEKSLLCRHLEHHFPEDPDQLPAHLKKLNPLTPHTFHTLARKALGRINGRKYPIPLAELEKERIIVHLFWCYHLFTIMGDNDLQYSTMKMIRSVYGNAGNENLADFAGKVKKRIYLKNRLKKIARIPDTHLAHLSGPIVRAAGKKQDCRLADPGYIGFVPVTADENNAWGQLMVRLGEILQSTSLVAGHEHDGKNRDDEENLGKHQQASPLGKSCLETPSGMACLDIFIRENKVDSIHLEVPAVALAALVPELTGGLELSDALLTVSALGFNPFELER